MATRAKDLEVANRIGGGIRYDAEARRAALAEVLRRRKPNLRGQSFEEELDRLAQIDAELFKVEG